MTPRLLELFAGIGGCATALHGLVEVVGVIDQDDAARQTYALRHRHPTQARNLHMVKPDFFARFGADLWWMSPPCQPYTIRGHQRDLEDRRAQAFVRTVAAIDALTPWAVAMENVPWFEGSDGEALLREVLDRHGYQVVQRTFCPTVLGVPAERRRYYLVACRDPLVEPPPMGLRPRPLRDYLWNDAPAHLDVEPELAERYRHALHIVDADDDQAVAVCFTGAYATSPVHAGSYLRQQGRVRRFAPQEIANTLGLGEVPFPEGLKSSKRYRLVGNSLSVYAVRAMLAHLPGLADALAQAQSRA